MLTIHKIYYSLNICLYFAQPFNKDIILAMGNILYKTYCFKWEEDRYGSIHVCNIVTCSTDSQKCILPSIYWKKDKKSCDCKFM